MMRSRWLGYVFVAVAGAVSLLTYPRMPPRVATHWNLEGDPDGYSSRLVATTVLPLAMLAMRGVLAILPAIDPRGENYKKLADTYWLIVNGVVGFLLLLHVVIAVSAVGYPVQVGRIAMGGVGLLLVLVGSYLGRVEPNWFIGVRTPWTLSSDSVWRRTHRVSGGILVAGGVAIVLTVFLPAPPLVIVIALLATVAVVPVVVSYLLWRNEQR
jgi:uncharacterized membrane protein